jgi:hypothetical protein
MFLHWQGGSLSKTWRPYTGIDYGSLYGFTGITGGPGNQFWGSTVAVSNGNAYAGSIKDDTLSTDSGFVEQWNVTLAPPSFPSSGTTFKQSGSTNFGNAIAVTASERLAIGAPGTSSGSGTAYIYDNGSLTYTLTNPNPYSTATNDNFGTSIAVNGSYIVVGAPLEDSTVGSNTGRVYIFSSTGSLLRTLEGTSTRSSAQFGYSVAINDTYVVVGAPKEVFDLVPGPGTGQGGQVYVYELATGNLVYTLVNPNPFGTIGGDNFGWSVAISNQYIAVGAPNEDSATNDQRGYAYVYNLSDGSLNQTIANPNLYGYSLANAYFGYSVALNDENLVVGAPNAIGGTPTYAGEIYIFRPGDGALKYSTQDPGTSNSGVAGSQFGTSVSLSPNGTWLIVGAPAADLASGFQDTGAVYIYKSDY